MVRGLQPAPSAESAATGGRMPTAALDKGDTAWVLICTALVLLMTMPGLALFFGGMVRQRNVLATLLPSLPALCVISLQWVLFGYSLAFGPDKGGLIGRRGWAGLVARR